MSTADRVQLIVQEWLSAHEEQRAWLRGPKGREWNEAYERCLDAVHRAMIREVEWRQWVEMQREVCEIVRALLSK